MATTSNDTEEPSDDLRAERAFSCTLCGYPTIREVGALRVEIRSVCLNCGDWTLKVADGETIHDAAAALAELLAGEVVTERQLHAYLLREVLSVDRQKATEMMDTSPSNVDNLHRRGREKIDEAKRLVAALNAITVDETAGEDPPVPCRNE